MDLKIKIIMISTIWLLVSACLGNARTAYQKEWNPEISSVVKKTGVQTRVPVRSASTFTLCSPEPGWVVGKGHPRYPIREFLTGVGISAESAFAAKQAATSDLAKSIKVDIKSRMQDFLSTEGAYVENAIETQVHTVLEGVERKDGHHDKCRNQYYSFVVMNRGVLVSQYQNRNNEIESRLRKNMDQGEKAEKTGNVIRAFSNYLEGYEASLDWEPQISTFQMLSKSKAAPASYEELNRNVFIMKLNALAQNVRLEIAEGNRQEINSSNIPEQPFVARAVLAANNKSVPAQSVPVDFQYEVGEGTLQADGTTDAKGTARARVKKVKTYDPEVHSVSVRLNIASIRSQINNEHFEQFQDILKSKRAVFSYSIKKIEGFATESSAWKSGLRVLVQKLIQNIDPDKKPVLGVLRFTDLRNSEITPFNSILVEDFKNLLARADNLVVKEVSMDSEDKTPLMEIAQKNQLDMYVVGSYRMENKGLQIMVKLLDAETDTYLGSGDALIQRQAIRPADLALLDTPSPEQTEIPTAPQKDEFRQDLDQLVTAQPEKQPFLLKVWAHQDSFQIGEKIVFFAKADQDSYLTLLSIGASGDVTVIFPNAYHKDNFIRAGVTYRVPAPDDEFDFEIQGPPGLERIKAIATPTAEWPIQLNLDKGFHVIESDEEGNQDIGVLAEKFSKNSKQVWAEDHQEIFIFPKSQVFTRGTRKIPITEKPEKPIDIIGTFGNEQYR